ncbi:hypothetical protein THAOC_27246, partial [Thalassiosira oceanica]
RRDADHAPLPVVDLGRVDSHLAAGHEAGAAVLRRREGVLDDAVAAPVARVVAVHPPGGVGQPAVGGEQALGRRLEPCEDCGRSRDGKLIDQTGFKGEARGTNKSSTG